MRYLIFSDLHGDEVAANSLLAHYQKYECDGMICLGDVLYHGPRNDLPEGYNPKKVIQLLNPYAAKILCIKGNCDAEVDQMVLNFSFYSSLDTQLNGHSCHLEHGHHLEPTAITAELIFSGHTHICSIEQRGKQVFLNPGSMSIPKNGTQPSFMIFDEKGIYLYDKDEHLLKQHIF